MACALPFSNVLPQPLIVVPPSLKFTVPVGVPEPPPLTLTVADDVQLHPAVKAIAKDIELVDGKMSLSDTNATRHRALCSAASA